MSRRSLTQGAKQGYIILYIYHSKGYYEHQHIQTLREKENKEKRRSKREGRRDKVKREREENSKTDLIAKQDREDLNRAEKNRTCIDQA